MSAQLNPFAGPNRYIHMKQMLIWTYSLTQMNHSTSTTDAAHVTYSTPAAINSNPELQTFSSAVSQSLHLQHMDTLQATDKMSCN
jgi:hypothetical protein